MRRVICLFIAVAMVAGLIVTGCAPGKKPHEIVEIKVYYARPGTVNYVLSVGLTEIISKNHPWLRATPEEGKASAITEQTLLEKPEMRKTHIPHTNDYADHWAKMGREIMIQEAGVLTISGIASCFTAIS